MHRWPPLIVQLDNLASHYYTYWERLYGHHFTINNGKFDITLPSRTGQRLYGHYITIEYMGRLVIALLRTENGICSNLSHHITACIEHRSFDIALL